MSWAYGEHSSTALGLNVLSIDFIFILFIVLSPKPILDTDDERTYFLVKLPINRYFISEAQVEVKDNIINKLLKENCF